MKMNRRVIVGTTAERGVEPNKDRSSLVIYNNSTTATVYYGSDTSLTTDDGVPIGPKTGFAFSVETGDNPEMAYYLLSTAADTDVRVGEGFAPKASTRSTPGGE
jgi:hypothetical protein